MICPECGSNISDDAQFCGNCGEVIKREIISPIKKPIISDLSNLDLTISLEGDAKVLGYLLAFPNKENEINIVVQNNSSNPIYDVEIKLTVPYQIYISLPQKEFEEIPPKTSKTASFTIIPQGYGTFTIIATLKSKVGHLLTLPIEVRSSTTDQIPIKTTIPSQGMDQATAALIIISLIAVILIIAGIPTIFSSTTTGITLIVIGLIFLGIGTKGKCLYCVGALAFCDCDC
ncbi:MAG: zinc ribbon domain-containing protein [Candidatus Hodarchaeota archaeon]